MLQIQKRDVMLTQCSPPHCLLVPGGAFVVSTGVVGLAVTLPAGVVMEG